MDTLENIRRKIESAGELESVVKTMKAMAASNIGQYEMAEASLNDYYRTVELGIMADFINEKKVVVEEKPKTKKENKVGALIFGSDQGLVGQFNDLIVQYAKESLNQFSEEKKIWAIGERVRDRLSDSGFKNPDLFSVPNSLSAITSLVGNILVDIEKSRELESVDEFYIFYNRPKENAGYEVHQQRLLPLDDQWKKDIEKKKWPTNKLPEVVGEKKTTLTALLKEYLFVSLYRACALSLASENASRLDAMQRAEKNINELLNELNHKYHRLRQETIDEELFDVVAGFEALKKKENK